MSDVNTVLVATDFSEHGEAAVGSAIRVALAFEATIHVVHALDAPLPVYSHFEAVLPDGLIEAAREAAASRLRTVEEKITAGGLEVHSHLMEAPAALAIARAAEELGADLIVVGTRGNKGLKHVFLGSVAEHTIRLAPCSALTVKTKEY